MDSKCNDTTSTGSNEEQQQQSTDGGTSNSTLLTRSSSGNSLEQHNDTILESTEKTLTNDDYKWHIIEGLKDGQCFEDKPTSHCGYMLKKRKRPLKGWHKRYFYLDHGILSYSKSASDMSKGKTHGSIDIGISVISTKSASRRIHIDSDSFIFHLKLKKEENFTAWVAALKNHRLSRQHEIYYGNQLFFNTCDSIYSLQSGNFNPCNNSEKPTSSNLITPILYNENTIKEKLIKLSSLLKFIELHSSSSNCTITDLEGFKYKKPRRRFNFRKKKHSAQFTAKLIEEANSAKVETVSLANQNFLSLSHPSLSEEDCLNQMLNKAKPANFDTESNKSFSKHEAMADFIKIANEINNSLRQAVKVLQEEQQQIPDLLDKTCTPTDLLEHSSIVARQSSIGEMSDFTFKRNLSRYSQDDSSVLSISEYYDAEDKMSPSDYNSSSEEEDDDDESVITDFSEDGVNYQQFEKQLDMPSAVVRRTKLSSIQPSSDFSLWSLLYKNIGKDLSKISMPVTINEPMNVLQRLCEELEYCELLDVAATQADPCQRMLLIAAFVVSGYSSSYYRAGHKPFNPLLGETYECVREDRGFKFVSEQVSHHPPISACYAESNNFIFWQDMRVKSKFWGKSMEIIPSGTVNVLLKSFNCHYKWNKITTCVHNLFKGERYVDNYGELTIKDSDNMTCKITFEKSTYWSGKNNEINGFILNPKGEVIEKIFGKWNESLNCGTRCIWRSGQMPDNYHHYYGFTKFAIELNELLESERPLLPPTDTRFRPDQRLLEEGNISKAEIVKLELEQAQRDRRKRKEENGLPEYIPLWFDKNMVDNEETYTFNEKYWNSRENHFAEVEFVKLW